MDNEDTNYNKKSGVSKKMMIFIACLLTLLGICYGVIYFGFYNVDDLEKEKDNLKTCKGTLEYIIDDEYEITDKIDLSEDLASKLYNEFKIEKSDKTDKMITSYTYSLEVCDLKIYYDDNSKSGSVLYGDTYYKIGNNKEYVKDFINNIIKDTQKVYFVDVFNGVKKIDLSDDDKKKIYELANKMEIKEAYIDLAIKRDYVLIIDDKKFYLDNSDGYAMYNKKLVKLDDNLVALLKPYLSSNSECCSCCPDLKPGEVCIAKCCPCDAS